MRFLERCTGPAIQVKHWGSLPLTMGFAGGETDFKVEQ
jgi:hypothetical protein